MTKELSNKGCCEKCFGKHPLENIGPCCHDSNCPCHQENNKKDYSHSHCWAQVKAPACGLSIEDHKRCCLCGAAAPHRSPSWEEEFDARFGNLRTKPNTTLSENPILMSMIKSLISTLIEEAKKSERKRIANIIHKHITFITHHQ